MMCITHSVFLFSVCKHTLNGLLPLLVELFAFVSLPYLFNKLQIFLPYMTVENFLTFLVCSA